MPGDSSSIVATDHQVRTLGAKQETLSANEQAEIALEAAGRATLDSLRSSVAAVPAPQPDLAEQIKVLAELQEIGRHVRYWRTDLILWLTEQTTRDD